MPESLLPYDGDVRLFPVAIPQAVADRLFARLLADTPWRQDKATVMGRTLPIPRLQAWYGAGSYVYSGIRLTPLPWSEPLLELKAVAERLAMRRFNSLLINLYRDGRDSVSWHADREPRLGHNPVIASLSLGATRRFLLRHKRLKTLVELDLGHGSALIMAGATQHNWAHSVPKTYRPVRPRINLTYRFMDEACAGQTPASA